MRDPANKVTNAPEPPLFIQHHVAMTTPRSRNNGSHDKNEKPAWHPLCYRLKQLKAYLKPLHSIKTLKLSIFFVSGLNRFVKGINAVVFAVVVIKSMFMFIYPSIIYFYYSIKQFNVMLGHTLGRYTKPLNSSAI